ncbi:MAG TPA: S-adenosylmethionine:tRNA ribosyltransferase-isomerase [Blastocatellia bacterium]
MLLPPRMIPDAIRDYLLPGDLFVANDAATLPASLFGRDARNNQVEIRLAARLDDRVWQAAVFGAGDWRTPTENRPSPPRFAEGEEILIAADFRAKVRGEDALSERLLNLEFDLSGEELWRNLYRYGNPVQYSHMHGELKLWSAQNVYSSRPWAAEMPSAGHALSWRLLLKLIRKGVRIAPLTHGAGLSSTGDEKIDRAPPLAERFEIPASTMEEVRRTKAGGGRVIAAGTSVVRALESAGQGLSGFTTLKLGPGYKRKIVDGLLTGAHDASESHYQLMLAFVPENVLAQVSRHFEREGYLTHEFGDLCLILNQLNPDYP